MIEPRRIVRGDCGKPLHKQELRLFAPARLVTAGEKDWHEHHLVSWTKQRNAGQQFSIPIALGQHERLQRMMCGLIEPSRTMILNRKPEVSHGLTKGVLA